MSRRRLQDKVIAVTGAGGGIGRAVCLELAREGAYVASLDSDRREAARTAAMVAECGSRSLGLRLDVLSEEQIVDSIRRVNEELGGIYGLVNNAGVLTLSPMIELRESDWDLVMDVNAKGVFLCSKLFAKDMIRRGTEGVVVNISSIAGKVPLEDQVHYCASKAAVIAITKVSALELSRHRIRVNAVCPGAVETKMFEQVVDHTSKVNGKRQEEVLKEILMGVEIGRLIKPEEIAKVVAFLCSEDSAAITGQAINVDGGNTSVNY
jgi:NAD(P)-dependent dehydrogenase (short-subunit alcohol dehydrogenase family)